MKQQLDKGNLIRILLMDMSKVFNTMNHILLLVILEAYGLSAISSNFYKVTSVIDFNELIKIVNSLIGQK